MTYKVQNIQQQEELAKDTLKKLLREKHGLENAVFNPFNYSSLTDFEEYFRELNQLGLDW